MVTSMVEAPLDYCNAGGVEENIKKFIRNTTLTPPGSLLSDQILPRMSPGTLDLEVPPKRGRLSGFNNLVSLFSPWVLLGSLNLEAAKGLGRLSGFYD